MSISVLCACGARLYLDDLMAGQEVICPDCQEKVKAPAVKQQQPRTSLLAVVSVVLALAGAFTVVGTVAAVLVGLAALVQIARHRDRLRGVGFALLGIIVGLLFTALTLFALTTGRVYDLGGRLREGMLRDQVDTTGPLTIRRDAAGFVITRPSDRWGVARQGPIEDVVVRALANDSDLFLVQTAHYAFVDVRRQSRAAATLHGCEAEVVAGLTLQPGPALEIPDTRRAPETQARRRGSQVLPPPRNEQGEEMTRVGGRELLVEVTCGQQVWTFLIRLYRTPAGELYTLRGYTRTPLYPLAEAEIRQALDSFRIIEDR